MKTAKNIAKGIIEDAGFDSVHDFENWKFGTSNAEFIDGNIAFCMDYTATEYCQVECRLSVMIKSEIDSRYYPAIVEDEIAKDIEAQFAIQLADRFHSLEAEQAQNEKRTEYRKRDYAQMQDTYNSLQYQF